MPADQPLLYVLTAATKEGQYSTNQDLMSGVFRERSDRQLGNYDGDQFLPAVGRAGTKTTQGVGEGGENRGDFRANVFPGRWQNGYLLPAALVRISSGVTHCIAMTASPKVIG